MRFSHDERPLKSNAARRLYVAGVAMLATAVILQGALSGAFVLRGDDMLYQGNPQRALAFYRRALDVDPGNAGAADRFVFVTMTLHRRVALRVALQLANDFLATHPNNSTLRMDRALCEWRLRLDRSAEQDFAGVGRQRGDARAYVFAGYAALRSGSRARAQEWWRAALTLDRTYYPALRALRLE
jgi:tetratricopeptide (TPR) repeat protein